LYFEKWRDFFHGVRIQKLAGRPVITSFGNHCSQLSGVRPSHFRCCRIHRRSCFPLVDREAILRQPQCRTTYSAVAYSHSICDVVSIRPVCLSFFLTAACLVSIPVCTAPQSVSKTSNPSLLIFYLSKTHRWLQLIYTVLCLSCLPLPNANGWGSDRSAPSAIFTSRVTPHRRKQNFFRFPVRLNEILFASL